MFRGSRLLVISPHPDDETLAAGGLLARAKAEGADTFVVVLSVATVAQHGSTSIADQRRTELGKAMSALDVSDYAILLDEHHHLQLDIIPRRTLVQALDVDSRLSIQNLKPDIVIVPGKSYNQDHNAIWEAAVTCLRPYPPDLRHSPSTVWTYSHFDEAHWNTDGTAVGSNLWIDISRYTDIKQAALGCYASQMKQSENHWRTLKNAHCRDLVEGRRVGCAAAEAFSVARWII